MRFNKAIRLLILGLLDKTIIDRQTDFVNLFGRMLKQYVETDI